MAKNTYVLGICVSARKNGNSSIILNELLKPSKEKGYQVEALNLGTLKIGHCIGCLGCSNEFHKCVLKDDLEVIKNKIEEADAIALASPCYYLSPPSRLKAVMDRSAAWAIDKMANSKKKKYGVAVSVAGGGQSVWYSLQRIYASLFLGLYNCEILGQFVIGQAFNKGEVLLSPSKLRLVGQLGENLASSIAQGRGIKSTINECEDKLICLNCLADAFQINKDGGPTCAVCGLSLNKDQSDQFNRFTPKGAQIHRSHIMNNVIGGILAGDEIAKRMKDYWERNLLHDNDFIIDTDLSNIDAAIQWDDEAMRELNQSIPKALQDIVKKALEKKATQQELNHITKEIFRQIRPKY